MHQVSQLVPLLSLSFERSKANLTVRIMRYEIEKGLRAIYFELRVLSSPRAKCAGPKGLRAESARAVTVQYEGGRLFDGSTKFFLRKQL